MEFIYRGLKARYERHIVTDEEVEMQLQRLQQQNPRLTVVTDRPARSGDEVVLDYAGFCGEEQFAGGTAQNQTLTLGSGQFIPGFEEQLMGHLPGEEVLVNVTFPQQYHAENLAGKEAQFRCTIHEIREKSAYAMDDTFAKEVGGCETFAQMREKMTQGMQRYCDDRGEMDLQDQLLRQAADTLDIEITEDELREAIDEQLSNLTAQLAQQGLNIEMYCQFLGTTPEQLREEAEPAARSAIRCRAAVEKITELERLEALPEEIDRALEVVCRQNGLTLEELKPYMDEEFDRAIRRSVLTGKVMELIRQAADIEEA